MGTTWGRRGMMRDPHGKHMGYMRDDVVNSRDPRGYDMGEPCGPNGLSRRDPGGSPLTKTGGSPLGIPSGSHIESHMGLLWVPTGVSSWEHGG